MNKSKMRNILSLASQISSIRKNQDPIYFFVNGQWNTLLLTDRLQLKSILNMFSIHILFSDEKEDLETNYSPFMTQVHNDFWRIIQYHDSHIIHHDIKVSFDQISESLKKCDFWNKIV